MVPSLRVNRFLAVRFTHIKDGKMRVTQGRTGRCRATSAVGLLVAAMLAQVAIADTASAAATRPMAASVYSAAATQVTINNNAHTYEVGTVPISGSFVGAGRYIGGATIEIWSRPTATVGSWTRIAVTRTNSTGRYGVNLNAMTTRYYQARFAGTYSWARSASPIIHLYARRIGTRFAYTSPGNTSVAYNGGVDIRGIVIDSHIRRVLGQRVKLFGLPQGASTWVLEANGVTNSAGAFVFSPRRQTVTIVYQVRMVGTAMWAPSVSPTLRLTVGKLNTKVSATLLDPTITPGAGAMVTGGVTDALGRSLAGQRVEIWSKPADSASWTHLGTAVTNSGGGYAYATRQLNSSTNFQARYTATGIWNASNSPVALQTVTTPPVTVVGWSKNAQLAANTADAINVYRASKGLSTLTVTPASDTLDSCVKTNTTGTICDPGVLASGYLTGPTVVQAWEGSPIHNATLVVPEWGKVSCTAYTHSDGGSSDIGCEFTF